MRGSLNLVFQPIKVLYIGHVTASSQSHSSLTPPWFLRRHFLARKFEFVVSTNYSPQFMSRDSAISLKAKSSTSWVVSRDRN